MNDLYMFLFQDYLNNIVRKQLFFCWFKSVSYTLMIIIMLVQSVFMLFTVWTIADAFS